MGRKKTPSRQDKRREIEAAEATAKADPDGKATKKKKAVKKKAVKKTTTRKKAKVKAPQRKRMVWAVFSGTMKEEARFLYAERKEAENKLEQLRSKATKKLYFIQPVKEPLQLSYFLIAVDHALKNPSHLLLGCSPLQVPDFYRCSLLDFPDLGHHVLSAAHQLISDFIHSRFLFRV